MALTIENDGPEIVASNYWNSEMARKGAFFLSFNEGAARLLVPDNRINEVREIETGTTLVILSRGPWAGKSAAIEMLFEYNSGMPYSISLGPEHIDRLIPASEHGRDLKFSAWRRNAVKLFERTAKFRMVERLPCLESWKG
jgi:hypothetical protein